MDTYASANAAYKAMAGIPVVGPALGVAAAAAAIGAGLANVKQIASARAGTAFITTAPTTLVVGDNPGGAERVQVTPLSSANTKGPPEGRSDVTLNISAPLVDDTVVDSIIPAIRKALQRGESLGI